MEVSGLVSRQIPYLSGAGIDTQSSKPLFSGDVHFPGRNVFGASLRTRMVVNSGFCDDGHVEYYCSALKFIGSETEKEIKKKLKLLKGLAEGLAAPLQGNLISESAEALVQQLEQVEADEEKELKKKKNKKKLEKAKIKAELMKTMNDGPSSLTIMLSGESEIGEGVTDTNSQIGLDADVDTDVGIGIDLYINVGNDANIEIIFDDGMKSGEDQ